MKQAWKKATKAGIGRIRKNARQALVVLMAMSMFLAGSCRLPERQAFFGPETSAAEIRAMLFSNWSRDESPPAAGYISQARDFIRDDPAILTALTERELLLVLGLPRMSRSEGTTGLWQYQSKSCTLSVYFGKIDGGRRQVLSYDVWSRTPLMQAGGIVEIEDQDETFCVREIIDAPQPALSDQESI